MKVTLIIPAHNEEAYIDDCLKSIERNASGFFHEIIVVDNASTDRTAMIALGHPGVRVIHEPQKGITWARQRGLEEAKGTALAYIDADTRLPSGWTARVTRAFNENPTLVCLSGPYRYYEGPRLKRRLLDAISWVILPIGNRLCGYMVVGGNFIVMRRAIRDAGGFDLQIDFFGEDTDIGRRINLLGKMLYDPKCFVFASARRFYAEGMFNANLIYLLNYLWIIIFHKPFSSSHLDVRTLFAHDEEDIGGTYDPTSLTT